MKGLALYHAIARGLWLIDPAYAASQITMLEDLLSGKEVKGIDPNAFAPMIMEPSENGNGFVAAHKIEMAASGAGSIGTFDRVPKGSLAIIPLQGTIMKSDQLCGPVGTETLAEILKDARESDNIIGAILLTDSPGGQVDGTATFANEVKKFAEVKPIRAFIQSGMAASAAYWAISGCTEIIASSNTDSVGSIGVFVQLADMEKFFSEKQGIKIHTIYSNRSPEKNLPVREALSGKYEMIQKDMLDPIADEFITTVEANRSGKLNSKEDPTKGALYMAKKALEIGLIDRIATYEEVVNSFSEPSSAPSSHKQATTYMKKLSFSAALAGLVALFNLKPEAGQEEVEIDASAENLEKLNGLATANTQLTQDLAEANSSIETHLGKIGELEAKVAELSEAPGAGPHSIVPQTPDKLESPASEANPFATGIDAEFEKLYGEKIQYPS